MKITWQSPGAAYVIRVQSRYYSHGSLLRGKIHNRKCVHKQSPTYWVWIIMEGDTLGKERTIAGFRSVCIHSRSRTIEIVWILELLSIVPICDVVVQLSEWQKKYLESRVYFYVTVIYADVQFCVSCIICSQIDYLSCVMTILEAAHTVYPRV